MKKIFLLILFIILLCSSAFAAGGACPSGANYQNTSSSTGLPLVTLSSLGVTNCYFIGVGGSDSNDGLSEASGHPWAHVPGMPNYTGSVTPSAGTGFIVEGGTVFHYGTGTPLVGGTWSMTHGGSSGSPVFFGSDPNWYSGGSWARPVLNGDNPLNTSFQSCTYAYASDIVLINASYITYDNFEVKGVCWNSTAANIAAMFDIPGGTNTNIIFSNNYCHGWSMPSTASDNFPCVTTFGAGTLNDSWQFAYNVFDGSDSPHFAIGDTTDCQYSGLNYVGCASGQGINGSHTWDLHGNIFRYLGNAVVTGNCHTVHDNLWEYIYNTYSGVANPQHPNLMNCLGGVAGQSTYFYNNVWRHTYINEDFYIPVMTNLYGFNNVSYDNMNSNDGTLPATCIRLNEVSASSSPVAVYWDHNLDDGTCQLRAATTNAPLTAFDGTITEQDNLFLAYSTTSSNICSGISCAQFANTHTTEGGATATFSETGTGDIFIDGQGQVTYSGTVLTNHSVGSGSFPFQTSGWSGGTILVPTQAAAPTEPFNLVPYTINTVSSSSALTTTAAMGTNASGSTYFEHITMNGQGGNAANGYAETSSSNTTYRAAANLTGSCSTFSPDSAMCNGSSFAVTETAANGGEIASYPAIPIIPRNSTWDVGPYQLGSAASFISSPTSVPMNTAFVYLTLTGTSTSWNGSTAFSVSGVTGTTLSSCSNNSTTSETCIIVTGYGTGTLTITDTTDSISTTITVAANPTATSFFGFNINSRGTNYPPPTIPWGTYRTLNSQINWAQIETSNGVYSWTNFDAYVSQATAAGVDIIYTLYFTPTFHSSNPTDSGCSGGLGWCDPPSDVNSDGSGTDAAFKAFVTALMTHAGTEIKYFEVWNEPNVTTEWTGANAQLVRMAQDARTIILGAYPSAKMLSPAFTTLVNNTAAAKVASYLSTSVSGSTGSQAADIIAFHGYTKTTTITTPIAEYMATIWSNLQANLSSTDLAKQFWDTEWGYTPTGLGDPDLNSGFIARHLLIQASLGVARAQYFNWNIPGSTNEEGLFQHTITGCVNSAGVANSNGFLCQYGTAYQQIENWLTGTIPTAACSGPAPPSQGVWSCAFVNPTTGLQILAVWDTSKTCSSGSCTTSTYSYSAPYNTYYYTLANNTQNTLTGGTVQIGYKPILLTSSLAPPPIPPSNLQGTVTITGTVGIQ